MRKYGYYFENLIKNSADQIGVDISDFQCNEDSIAFEVDGVSVFGFLIPVEGGAKLRLLYDVVNVEFSPYDSDKLLQAYNKINEYNLLEGGMLQLVLVPSDNEDKLQLFLKAIDVVAIDDIMYTEELRNYFINLFADILMFVNNLEVFNEEYLSQFERIASQQEDNVKSHY